MMPNQNSHALDALCKRCNNTGLMRCEGARLDFVPGGGFVGEAMDCYH